MAKVKIKDQTGEVFELDCHDYDFGGENTAYLYWIANDEIVIKAVYYGIMNFEVIVPSTRSE